MALLQTALRAPSIPMDVAQRATPEVEGLVGIGITTQASPGQTIVLEGDPCSHCFRVLTGAVRLYKGTADGRRQLIDFLVAGDCFGLFGAFYTYSVEAITHATLSKTPRATLAAAVRQQPALADRLIELAAAKLARAHEHMLLLGRKNAGEGHVPAPRAGPPHRCGPSEALFPAADLTPGDGRPSRPHHRDREPHHDASAGGGPDRAADAPRRRAPSPGRALDARGRHHITG